MDGAVDLAVTAAPPGRWLVTEPAYEDPPSGARTAVAHDPVPPGLASLHALRVSGESEADHCLAALARNASPDSRNHRGPSVDLPLRVHSRRDRSLGLDFGPECLPGQLGTRSVHVVSHHLDGLLRAPHRNGSDACPASGRTRSQVYCNLLPTGVRRVFDGGRLTDEHRCSAWRPHHRVLATRSYPPKIPSSAAGRCHHRRCPRDVPSIARTAQNPDSACARLRAAGIRGPGRPGGLESAEADLHAPFFPCRSRSRTVPLPKPHVAAFGRQPPSRRCSADESGRRTAVASCEDAPPSMGFVPLRGTISSSAPPATGPKPGGDRPLARTGWNDPSGGSRPAPKREPSRRSLSGAEICGDSARSLRTGWRWHRRPPWGC
jgi:hypothetical protein